MATTIAFNPSSLTFLWFGLPGGRNYEVAMPMTYPATLWRGLAREACNAAAQTKDPDLKLQVLLVAARYLVLARRAEAVSTSAGEEDGGGLDGAGLPRAPGH